MFRVHPCPKTQRNSRRPVELNLEQSARLIRLVLHRVAHQT
jgi:hypothetical protein